MSSARVAAFGFGVFALWVAVGSPLAGLDYRLLTAHMAQHLLLMTVAAPLLLLGAPVPRRFARRIHPVFCWLASTAVVIGWHIPALFQLGMHPGWHEVEHATFLIAGLLFWLPVIQPWASPVDRSDWYIPLYLFLATLPCDALSAFLTFCNRVVYPHYLSAARPLDISALADQECAGALMWVCVTFAYLTPAAAATLRLLSPQRLAVKAEPV
jgi:putative membrane protein